MGAAEQKKSLVEEEVLGLALDVLGKDLGGPAPVVKVVGLKVLDDLIKKVRAAFKH